MPALPEPLTTQVVLWILVGLATIWDVSQRRIPNPLVLVGILLGMFFSTQSGGLPGLGHSVLGIVVALALLIVPFAANKLGGGDVKLAMVCGAFLFWDGAIHVVLIGTALHGILALGVLVAIKSSPALEGLAESSKKIPHAVGYAVATVIYTLGLVRFF